MEKRLPEHTVSYQLTLAPTKVYLALQRLAAQLSDVRMAPLPADSPDEICNSALAYSRFVEGSSEETQQAERAMSVGGAVLQLQAKDKSRFDIFHSYCEELLSIIPLDCPDEGLDLQ